MLKILFWGTGKYAIEWIEENKNLFEIIKYKKFINKNHKKNTNELFLKYKVIAPCEISREIYDYICIMSSFQNEIMEEAINIYKIPSDKIINVNQLSNMVIGKLYYKDDDALYDAEKKFGKVLLIRYLIQYNYQISNLIKSYYDYEYLSKKYDSFINNYTPIKKYDESIYSNKQEKYNKTIIWTCWLQGYENAPDIVKACINSIKRYMPNNKIILLTEKNFERYIHIPEYILRKYKKGIISRTHFSDILRLEVLVTYGGIWIDATVLLTGTIPTYIENSSLFLFKFNIEQTVDPRTIRNWFIVSKKENEILILVKKLIYKYWKENNKLVNYFFFHYFFRMATERFPLEWNNSIHFDSNTNILVEILFDKFIQEKYIFIKNLSFCQKLSYKFSMPDIKYKTFYNIILDEYL